MDAPEEPAGDADALPASQTAGSLAKRRKLRKGTRSCWECKRRKIRCMFAVPGDTACAGCQHRHVPCVSQKVAEDPALARKRANPARLGERVARVEALLDVFLARRQADDDDGDPSGQPSLASPIAPRHDSERYVESPAAPPCRPPDSHPEQADPLPAGTDTAARHLFAALPTGADVQILLRECSRPSRYVHLVIAQPHSKLTLEYLSAPHPTAQPPPPRADTHPVLLARLMLNFAITLQSPSGEQIRGLSEAPDALMHRLVSAARAWVTTREEMHGSLECLVCIMLEGMYEINGGNLRRAWAAFRRAMAVAQLMGLNCSPASRRIPRLDPALDADARSMWFRIVAADRHLSLLLGLPQGSLDKTMGEAASLQGEPPLGRFERLLAVIACRVLERNEAAASATDQLAATQSIDAELLSASRSMPVSFWRVPSFHSQRPGSPETLLETVRLAAHVYYHGLLIQLHLPYIVQVGSRAALEYAKITCANSSREIMTRFVSHRTFNPKSSCSRPVDFFAFLAAMTLLLAHLEAHRLRVTPDVLAHQRLGDRALLEQCLETMDAIRDLNKDPVAGKSAEVIRRLMDMEADAADGGTYATTSSVVEDGEEAEGVRLSIPYLGVINISRQDPISRERPGTPAVAWCSDQSTLLPRPGSGMDRMTPLSPTEFTQLVAGVDDWTFQGVDTAFFDGLMRGGA